MAYRKTFQTLLLGFRFVLPDGKQLAPFKCCSNGMFKCFVGMVFEFYGWQQCVLSINLRKFATVTTETRKAKITS